MSREVVILPPPPRHKFVVMSVIGTRPEVIKMASVIKELGRRDSVASIVVATAQHRHLLDQALQFFAIKPDKDLDLMRMEQTPCDIVGRLLLHLEPIIEKFKPDCVLVQGDTATALGASLATAYKRILLGHVEAGLRSGDKASPFPEEQNRLLIDSIADCYFAPTDSARDNLLMEGHRGKNIFVVGNTSIDVLKDLLADPRQIDSETVNQICQPGKRVILVTTHRSENLGKPLTSFCETIRKIASDFSDIQIIFPMHPNPEIRDIVMPILSGCGNISLLEPLVYNVFIPLIQRAYFVITDSAGVQEEAAYLGKPTLVLREKTERPESIESGTALLVGNDPAKLYLNATRLLSDPEFHKKMGRPTNPYGNTRAAKRLVDQLIAVLDSNSSSVIVQKRV